MCPELEDEETIFYNALDIKSPTERTAFLKRACGTDKELLSRIEALLDVQRTEHSFLESAAPHLGIALEEESLSEGPRTVIGRYKLLEKIGEGGMAVVYMAEQTEPIRRKVALKIIKLGMDTKSVIARFEAERQALAMMDHPNIAKVFDAGATETGRPYFVMELVTGVSITEYCDENNLSTKDRLALFIQVCNAVQHAHQKGIIHRDIKPTNVLVTQYEGTPVPKVIDFGIAKAISQRLTEKTIFTRYAHFIGTPTYMSPEQADMSDLDIDTRSDIYSLGVLLYELLTGTTPFSERELCKAGYSEMQRIIIEKEPPKPSTRLNTLGETLTDIAEYRSSTPDLLKKAIRGDLDWIVMKSLEKIRERRYDTASALSMDVQRHLKDEPIFARAPGTFYLVQKFLRRHRSRVVAVLVTVALLGVIIVMSLKLIRFAATEATRDRDILDQINILLENNDLKGAIRDLEMIVSSRYVGIKARLLQDRVLSNLHQEISDCTLKIMNDPGDSASHLKRAQLFHCMGKKDAVLADMNKYLAILYPTDEVDQQSQPIYVFLRRLWTNTPVNLGPSVNTPSSEWAPCISTIGSSLLFTSNRASTSQDKDLWVATRSNLSDPWGQATPLGPPVDSLALDGFPAISFDGLSLYFASMRDGWDLYMSTRTKTDDNWGPPASLGSTINSPFQETRPAISADGCEFFFTSNRPGVYGNEDIYVSTRATTEDPWREPINLGSPLNSPLTDGYPNISADGRLLFFSSFRPDGSGSADLYVTMRKTKTDDWGPPVNLGPTVNSPYEEPCCCISADSSAFYFASRRPEGRGGLDLWQVSITSIPEAEQEDHSDSIQITEEDNDGKEVIP